MELLIVGIILALFINFLFPVMTNQIFECRRMCFHILKGNRRKKLVLNLSPLMKDDKLQLGLNLFRKIDSIHEQIEGYYTDSLDKERLYHEKIKSMYESFTPVISEIYEEIKEFLSRYKKADWKERKNLHNAFNRNYHIITKTLNEMSHKMQELYEEEMQYKEDTERAMVDLAKKERVYNPFRDLELISHENTDIQSLVQKYDKENRKIKKTS